VALLNKQEVTVGLAGPAALDAEPPTAFQQSDQASNRAPGNAYLFDQEVITGIASSGFYIQMQSNPESKASRRMRQAGRIDGAHPIVAIFEGLYGLLCDSHDVFHGAIAGEAGLEYIGHL
jgi:hypothetical protein